MGCDSSLAAQTIWRSARQHDLHARTPRVDARLLLSAMHRLAALCCLAAVSSESYIHARHSSFPTRVRLSSGQRIWTALVVLLPLHRRENRGATYDPTRKRKIKSE